jgi:hypothetical protein
VNARHHDLTVIRTQIAFKWCSVLAPNIRHDCGGGKDPATVEDSMAARLVGVTAVVAVVLVGAGISAQEILTNDVVISMVKAGLSESLVIAKIRASTTKFDLRADTLISLKAAGVPERVIEAMLAPSGPGAALAPPPGSTAASR